jgi:hypothetical protein
MSALRVDEQAMSRNLGSSKEQIIAEPLYVLLALQGCPNAYERVRKLAREAREQHKAIMELARQDQELRAYISKMGPEQQQVLDDPAKYTGQSSQRTIAVCEHWKREATSLRNYLAEEKAALANIKGQRFSHVYKWLTSIEQGEPVPKDFCPAEDRRQFIAECIMGSGKL